MSRDKYEKEVADVANRRRLVSGGGAMKAIKTFCDGWNKITSREGEKQIGIFDFEMWASVLAQGFDDVGHFMRTITGIGDVVKPSPAVIIPDVLQIDMGLKFSFGFNWDYQDKKDGKKQPKKPKDWLGDCPISFKMSKMFTRLNKVELPFELQDIIKKCCKKFAEVQRQCDKTLQNAHEEGNKCLKSTNYCEEIGKIKDQIAKKFLNENSKQHQIAKEYLDVTLFEFVEDFEAPSLKFIIVWLVKISSTNGTQDFYNPSGKDMGLLIIKLAQRMLTGLAKQDGVCTPPKGAKEKAGDKAKSYAFGLAMKTVAKVAKAAVGIKENSTANSTAKSSVKDITTEMMTDIIGIKDFFLQAVDRAKYWKQKRYGCERKKNSKG
eukprot:521306_1